jgi:hypothetical protein
MKYRKKPVAIEAFRFGMEAAPEWFSQGIKDGLVTVIESAFQEAVPALMKEKICKIKTLEGTIFAKHGDYVIQGIMGELYPCREDIFNKTYELIN